MNITAHSVDELATTASSILAFSSPQKIFLFYGEMGVGKTTLIKEFCRLLGVKEQASSPTFSIVNEYKGDNGNIYHFDFYRLKNQMEALDMGYEEYFYSGDYCFIEWPEKIPDLLPAHYIRLMLMVGEQQVRHIQADII